MSALTVDVLGKVVAVDAPPPLLVELRATLAVLTITYGDAGDAVAAIERAATRPDRSMEPAEALVPITDATTTVAVGDALAVLHEPTGKIHLLNAAAATVWRRAAGTAAARDGDLDGSMAAATVNQLVQAGLLVEPAGA